MTIMPPSTRGFTLIELLIALAIFAILSAISYRTLTSVFATREALQHQTAKLRDRALFFHRLESDFAALLNRPITDADGNTVSALKMTAYTANAEQPAITFTRSGFVGADDRNAAPQRVGYRLREGVLELMLWVGLDQAPRASAKGYAALPGVRAARWRALDASGNWQSEWPPNASTSREGDPFPRAIELSITEVNGETFNRLFAMRASQLSDPGAGQ